ncbi:radical SAM/SPASM domain-containing protein [Actinomadura fulvescens]|uniref:Radical SAM/SPASM domain-containing protein n=2 Tax=Actinomadura fulvescens TaxID=46160 RepID=A0ABP6CKA5_9ACTN
MHATQFLVASDEVLLDDGGNPVRLVLQTASEQVYVLADDVLQRLVGRPAALSDGERAELAAADLLVADSRDEFSEVVEENRAYLAKLTDRMFVLMPAAYCNMGCGYCGQKHFRLPKREQHRDAIKRRLIAAAEDPSTSGISVAWFGAEPMMGYAQILDLSAAVIPACGSAGIPYSAKMVTNGALLTLDKIRRLYHECRLRFFEITLDGDAETHNSQRPLKSGRGSFGHIVNVIRQACDEDLPGLQFSIRTNVSRANQGRHAQFAREMQDAGLADPRVSFYATPVREWGNDVSDYAIAHRDVVDVERDWLEAYADHGLAAGTLPIERRHMVCVAVNRRAEVIAPAGQLHSCTEQPLVPGREDTALGHVTQAQSAELRPEGRYDDWNKNLLGDTSAFCPSCAIFPICGGACPLVWDEGNPACPPVKFSLPMRLTRYGLHLGLRNAV